MQDENLALVAFEKLWVETNREIPRTDAAFFFMAAWKIRQADIEVIIDFMQDVVVRLEEFGRRIDSVENDT